MEPQAFFGVYDGHGGAEAARFTQAQLHCNIVSRETFCDDLPKALVEGYLETDKQFLRKADRDVRLWKREKRYGESARERVCRATRS